MHMQSLPSGTAWSYGVSGQLLQHDQTAHSCGDQHLLVITLVTKAHGVMQGSGDVHPFGIPIGFTPTPLRQHTPSHPILVTTQMSRDRSVKQLILMSDGHYLSSETSSMMLRLVVYNSDARALAYVQVPFKWQAAGVIGVGPPQILALPVLAYSSSR